VDGRGRAVNLSRTGILLATDTAPGPSEELSVRLAGLEAAARVVRVERRKDAQAPFLVGAAFEAPLDDVVVAPRVLTHAAGRPARGTRGR
jgi:hypothetical protein